jgi:hypothetical protein
MVVLLSESSIAALHSNLFEKLGKSLMKIETYILIFQTQKISYKKDKYSIQGQFYKGWYIQCHNPNYPKNLSLWIYFFLIELKTKLIFFYHQTLKHHTTQDEKIKQEKVSPKF